MDGKRTNWGRHRGIRCGEPPNNRPGKAKGAECSPSQESRGRLTATWHTRAVRRSSSSYSASIPAAFTIRPHFCDSLVWNLPSSSGEVVNTSVPVGS